MEAKSTTNANANHSPNNGTTVLNRASFPEEFIFGTASSAYQYEGAAKEGGRGPSIWDSFSQKWPSKISDGSNGNVAVGFYYQYKDDVKIMKKMGLDAFRFSISWSRILPSGKLSQGVNKEGIRFYNDLIDELLANGITPFVTLFHWDVPQALEDEYGGFLNRQIVGDFCDFADICFWEFGDRVKNWITLNEPFSFSNFGYCTGLHAPGRGGATPVNFSGEDGARNVQMEPASTQPEPINYGNPATEPYIVTHHQLLAHAVAVDLYRKHYQECQEGKIGITIVSTWMEPYSDSQADKDARDRALDFIFGWFMDPLVNGKYPESMQNLLGSRLREFSEIESQKLKGSFDFLGLNYYTAMYVKDAQKSNSEKLSYTTDPKVEFTYHKDNVAIGPQAGCDWHYIYPKGFFDLLAYTKKKYNNPVIYITENGMGDKDNVKLTLAEARVDKTRKDFLIDHLLHLKKAIEHGVDIRGYFQWSFLDNYEWADGYTVRFGMIYVDYKDDKLTRYPKDSALWFMNFLKKRGTPKPLENSLVH